jgi:hypothetical protein
MVGGGQGWRPKRTSRAETGHEWSQGSDGGTGTPTWTVVEAIRRLPLAQRGCIRPVSGTGRPRRVTCALTATVSTYGSAALTSTGAGTYPKQQAIELNMPASHSSDIYSRGPGSPSLPFEPAPEQSAQSGKRTGPSSQGSSRKKARVLDKDEESIDIDPALIEKDEKPKPTRGAR